MKLVYSTTKLSTNCDNSLATIKDNLKNAKIAASTVSNYGSLDIGNYLLSLPSLIDSFLTDIETIKEDIKQVDANYNMLADDIDNQISKLESTKIVKRDSIIKY